MGAMVYSGIKPYSQGTYNTIIRRYISFLLTVLLTQNVPSHSFIGFYFIRKRKPEDRKTIFCAIHDIRPAHLVDCYGLTVRYLYQ